MVGLAEAKKILTSVGWLSQQPKEFQADVLRRSNLMRFAPGDVVYRHGGPLGGIYGLVAGAVTATTAPPIATPRLLHLGRPGFWVGEGCFLSREPRRVGIQAVVETWMMHLPLDAMDQMERQDPMIVRRVVQILMMNLDVLVEAFYQLHKPDEDRRIAAALQRITPTVNTPVPLSQTELGSMSNTSRKQVNAALKRFADAGWLTRGYRSIIIKDIEGLRRFSAGEDD